MDGCLPLPSHLLDLLIPLSSLNSQISHGWLPAHLPLLQAKTHRSRHYRPSYLRPRPLLPLFSSPISNCLNPSPLECCCKFQQLSRTFSKRLQSTSPGPRIVSLSRVSRNNNLQSHNNFNRCPPLIDLIKVSLTLHISPIPNLPGGPTGGTGIPCVLTNVNRGRTRSRERRRNTSNGGDCWR
jgi:hypothetical protein